MKRLIKCMCLLLVLSMMLAVPAMAAENEARASNYFGSISCYLSNVSSSGFQVWFDVAAVRIMSELGASTIKVQKSPDGVNWSTVQTYYKADYPQMTTRIGTASHGAYVPFSNVDTGNYYRGYVEFYAADSNGSATKSGYTESVYIP